MLHVFAFLGFRQAQSQAAEFGRRDGHVRLIKIN
jgi:hypothetical protein